jgi:hypothetical protein
MTGFQLEQAVCPRCAQPMQVGYIAGEWHPIRWVESPRLATILTGEPLHTKGLFGTATLRAARCPACRIGVFVYDDPSP